MAELQKSDTWFMYLKTPVCIVYVLTYIADLLLFLIFFICPSLFGVPSLGIWIFHLASPGDNGTSPSLIDLVSCTWGGNGLWSTCIIWSVLIIPRVYISRLSDWYSCITTCVYTNVVPAIGLFSKHFGNYFSENICMSSIHITKELYKNTCTLKEVNVVPAIGKRFGNYNSKNVCMSSIHITKEFYKNTCTLKEANVVPAIGKRFGNYNSKNLCMSSIHITKELYKNTCTLKEVNVVPAIGKRFGNYNSKNVCMSSIHITKRLYKNICVYWRRLMWFLLPAIGLFVMHFGDNISKKVWNLYTQENNCIRTLCVHWKRRMWY